MEPSTTLLIFAGFIAAYLMPFVIAKLRNLVASDGILILNLFLGWTILGWFGALIWSVSAQTKRVAHVQQ